MGWSLRIAGFRRIAAFVALSALTGGVLAGVYEVPKDCPTVQEAIDAAADGDEIIVSPGQYEFARFGGRNVVLRSTNPTSPTVVETTRLMGVEFSGTETPECRVEGFSITNEIDSSETLCVFGRGTRATIRNNVIGDIEAHGYWGAYERVTTALARGIWDCDGLIENNTFRNIRAFGWEGYRQFPDYQWVRVYAAAVGISSCDGIVRNNIFSNIVTSRPWDDITQGNGVSYCEGVIVNNTIVGTGGSGAVGCPGTFRNNILWDQGDRLRAPVSPEYCCIENWTGDGLGNVSLPPHFADPDNGDFHLTNLSYCLDSGGAVADLYFDFEGDIRPYNSIGLARGDGSDIDIGADEFLGAAAPPPPTPTVTPTPTFTPTPTPTPTPCTDPIYVPGDHPTIQAAIDAAGEGCEIIVAPGTYEEKIHFGGKNLVVRSTDPTSPSVVAATVIGRVQGSVVTFEGPEDETCVLEGFTITQGGADFGGGINGGGTHATIRHNVITGNFCWVPDTAVTPGMWSGGAGIAWCQGRIEYNEIVGNWGMEVGLYPPDEGTLPAYGGGLYECNGVIQGNRIAGNQASLGGGLAFCHGVIRNNRIVNNASGEGGGLAWCENATIENNLVAFNTCGIAGAGFHSCSGLIRNNTVWGNGTGNTDRGGGFYGCSEAAILNCIVWGNLAAEDPQIDSWGTLAYCCIEGGAEGEETILTDNPQLVDPEEGDFHLLPTSPCIDAGDAAPGLTIDFEGDPRPFDGWQDPARPRGNGSDYDIGADEYTVDLTDLSTGFQLH